MALHMKQYSKTHPIHQPYQVLLQKQEQAHSSQAMLDWANPAIYNSEIGSTTAFLFTRDIEESSTAMPVQEQPALESNGMRLAAAISGPLCALLLIIGGVLALYYKGFFAIENEVSSRNRSNRTNVHQHPHKNKPTKDHSVKDQQLNHQHHSNQHSLPQSGRNHTRLSHRKMRSKRSMRHVTTDGSVRADGVASIGATAVGATIASGGLRRHRSIAALQYPEAVITTVGSNNTPVINAAISNSCTHNGSSPQRTPTPILTGTSAMINSFLAPTGSVRKTPTITGLPRLGHHNQQDDKASKQSLSALQLSQQPITSQPLQGLHLSACPSLTGGTTATTANGGSISSASRFYSPAYSQQQLPYLGAPTTTLRGSSATLNTLEDYLTLCPEDDTPLAKRAHTYPNPTTAVTPDITCANNLAPGHTTSPDRSTSRPLSSIPLQSHSIHIFSDSNPLINTAYNNSRILTPPESMAHSISTHDHIIHIHSDVRNEQSTDIEKTSAPVQIPMTAKTADTTYHIRWKNSQIATSRLVNNNDSSQQRQLQALLLKLSEVSDSEGLWTDEDDSDDFDDEDSSDDDMRETIAEYSEWLESVHGAQTSSLLDLEGAFGSEDCKSVTQSESKLAVRLSNQPRSRPHSRNGSITDGANSQRQHQSYTAHQSFEARLKQQLHLQQYQHQQLILSRVAENVSTSPRGMHVIDSIDTSKSTWKLGGLKYISREESKRLHAERRAAARRRSHRESHSMVSRVSSTAQRRHDQKRRSSRRSSRRSMLSSVGISGEQSFGVNSSEYESFHAW
ncbi:hypothetical protein BATDEDRAFT_21190 [Batrachochytrium dendrobatidis JAM81]|uniref:Uncharacterized protein n=1 Tax=Batrachochytrium dendrobatidis (strain JAM81 / FGSC 10211) TaxID=684364 RepID=F4NRL6_BATDJ|nr:uncharacterized protein BATDEDRAFT_21190 [Batrachochytrium dendrobatidis JAM81]EGF82942.1 hypothetical protein BATDEDRAFT_21190 [Batrachochytrium dendrobatidis JAM81]KAJ8331721.1 hypothetical protein O5D80_000617 [Batrachochytrium dendrobatidis]KAK5672166.1 hypothetical protein QVD99_001973 [Batrachochytrium dendrobatidis]|eukprot:XP_006675223.1 hypothetical protein BATDEDRAFT_21190 [Batrachochytrium dendrobatidis JAM81]